MYGPIAPLVSQFLTPDLVAKMASTSGISDIAGAQKTLSGAVPALLSGLANLASKPEGARQLSDTIVKQPSNMLDNLAGMIGDSGQLANIGKSALTGLFGSTTLSALTNALGRYGGVGEGAARSLLAMLTPVLLGILGKQAGTGASGLAQWLASQRDHFSSAIPPGLTDLLKASGAPVDRIGTVSEAAGRSNSTYRGAAENSGPAYAMSSSRPAESSARWAYWALPLLAIAGVAWYLWGGERVAQPVAKGPSQASQGLLPDTDLQGQITAAINSLHGTLQGVKDGSAARMALPKLQQAASEFDRLSGMVNRLPVETRDRLAAAIKTAAANLKTTLDNVDATPGMATEAGPVLATLRTRLDALAMTPGSLAQRRAGLIAERLYLTRTPSGGVLISAYFDRSVHNRAGERIGSVNDLIVSPDTTIAAALVGVGGFLGIGEKEVAVPFSMIEVVRRDNDWHLVIDATKEALKDAPSYEDTTTRVRLSPGAGTNR